jgi:hypothetical protein
MENTTSDVMCLLSDDVLMKKGTIRAVRAFWEKYSYFPIGCAQIPYWGSWDDIRRMGLLKCGDYFPIDAFYDSWRSWINKVPFNDHWVNGWIPRSYINVHGCGFSLRRDVWRAVGGFSKETWCYDEDISAKVWLYTPCVIATIPGPPMVHFGGASQCGTEHPETNFHTLEAWCEAWGATKEYMHRSLRKKMAERAYIDDLFKMTGAPVNALEHREALMRYENGV